MVHRVCNLEGWQAWSHSGRIGALVGSDGLCHLGPGDLRGQLGQTRSLWSDGLCHIGPGDLRDQLAWTGSLGSGWSQADLTAGLRLTY